MSDRVVEVLTTSEQARVLAERLLDRARSRPLALVSTAAGHRDPFIDVDALIAEVEDVCDVIVIETGEATWSLSQSLPPLTQVYGGAGRVYPIGIGWQMQPRVSPLRFAHGLHDRDRTTALLVSDALSMALEAGLFDRATPGRARVDVTGTVLGIPVPSRAMVSHAGGLATISPETMGVDVDLAHLVSRGMQVTGTLDVASGRLDVRSSLSGADEALAGVRPGDVVLARVTAVEPASASFRLHPQLDVVVSGSGITANPLDRLNSLLTVGEVVLARVVTTSPVWSLSLLDIDESDVAVPAPSLLPGGPPWLDPPPEPGQEPEWVEASRADGITEQLDELPVPAVVGAAAAPEPEGTAASAALVPTTEPRDRARTVGPNPGWLRPGRTLTPELAAHRTTSAQEPTPAEPVVAPKRALQDTTRALEASRAEAAAATRAAGEQGMEAVALRQENEGLLAELRRTGLELARAQVELQRQRTQLRKATTGRQRAERALHAPAGSDAQWLDEAFLDEEERLRFEVTLAWARRIPASDKRGRPLADYSLSDRFIPSLNDLEGIDRGKVVEVMVEVVTGLVDEVNGRETHRLRMGSGGGAAPRTRADGATCWRASLQVNTPSARRIHFWRGSTGIEFSRVVVHDDTDP